MGFLKASLLVLCTALFMGYLSNYFRPTVPKTVGGHCEPGFTKIQQAFRENLESGRERGAAFSVYHEGKKVCDLWGGFADEDIEYPYKEDTLVMFWSTTKGLAAICIALLVDRGLLDYDKPVAQYWPEFAQNGKADVTLSMLVSHQAGLAALDVDLDILDLKNDPEKVGQAIASQKPNWEPGSQAGYHALTFGIIMDQLIRRVDTQHRDLQQFFREEIAIPFGIDAFIGLPREETYRVSRFQNMSPGKLLYSAIGDNPSFMVALKMILQQDELWNRATNNPKMGDAVDTYLVNWPEYKEIVHGSINGHGTASALAKLYGILANGGNHDNKQLLTQKTIERLAQAIYTGFERLLQAPNSAWGHGVVVTPMVTGTKRAFGHPGYGSQIGWADLHYNIGVGYLTNYPSMRMDDSDPRYVHLRNALIECLKDKGY